MVEIEARKRTKPSREYLARVRIPSNTLNSPLKQLLILDLNGTLVSRVNRSTTLYSRPYQDRFFDYIFKHFTVMVWSSARPHNVDNMCRIFGKYRQKLVLTWDRDYFGFTAKEYNSKTVSIKDLDKVWQILTEFDASNTVLLDDSPVKTVLQPFNHCVVSEFDHKSSAFRQLGENELVHVQAYLEKLRYQDNISHYIKHHPYVSTTTPISLSTTTTTTDNNSVADTDNGDDDDYRPLLERYPPTTRCYHYIFTQTADCPRAAPALVDLGVDNLVSEMKQLNIA